MKIDYVEDACHGWFKLTNEHQKMLDLDKHSFSEYSYIESDGTIWAEEDCDCRAIFHKAESKGIKIIVNHIHVNGDSWIRTLPRCHYPIIKTES